MRVRAFLALTCLMVLGLACECPFRSGEKSGRTAPVAKGERPAIPGLAQPRNDLPDLANFSRVSDTLYRGAQPGPEGFAELKRMGVRTVVNLRDHHSDRDDIRGLGLRYVHIPCETSDPELDQVVTFLQVVTDPANQPAFVHCMHGSDRTGMMVASYRMVVEGWPRQKALAELEPFGFHPMWRDIRKFLDALDPSAVRAALRQARVPRVETVP
jgi:protein tyrosine phosphatase (PTP) superfamily phosphohydrolase (DUF442 family)